MSKTGLFVIKLQESWVKKNPSLTIKKTEVCQQGLKPSIVEDF